MRFSRSSLIRTAALTVVAAGVAALYGCAVSVPKGIQPVTGFDAKRYMGTWYELARIEHSFEKRSDSGLCAVQPQRRWHSGRGQSRL